MTGYVYLIGSKRFGWYKIGKSIRPDVRVSDIGVMLPFQIELLALWKAANHSELEITLHRVHSDCRINGEWFSLDKERLEMLLEYETTHAIRVDGAVAFQSPVKDVVIDGYKDQRREKGYAFVMAMLQYLSDNQLEDTAENRKIARKAVKEKFSTKR